MRRRLIPWALLFVLAAPAPAWKGGVHAYLAFIARADALDDGRITLYKVDRSTGRIAVDASGRPVVVGHYPVDPRILSAIRDYPDHFKAGAVAIDSLPELLAAQTGIHPDNSAKGGSLSTDWVRGIWEAAWNRYEPRALAFAAGVLTHAAGDIYGHTFINSYAGGPWELGQNALKHFILESYIDRRTPKDEGFYRLSIDGLEGFLHDNLIATSLVWDDAKSNNLTDPGYFFNYSPVRLYRALRWRLSDFRIETLAEVAQAGRDVQARIRDMRAEAKRVITSDPVQAAKLGSEATALAAAWKVEETSLRAFLLYIAHWISDIDSGLRAWPRFGFRLTQTLFFSPSVDRQAIQGVIEDFSNAHLYSMSGSPDIVGDVQAFRKKVWEWLPDFITKPIDVLTTDPMLYLLEKAWGFTWDIISDPEVHFNPIMSQGPGTPTSLREFNQNVLGIRDAGADSGETYDWLRIPAMVNSVTLMKIALLGPGGLEALASDLEVRGLTSNTAGSLLAFQPADVPITAGYLRTLDGSNQWCLPPRLLFARDPCVYRLLFLGQPGEDQPGCVGDCDLPEDGTITAGPMTFLLARQESQYLGIKTDGSAWNWGTQFSTAAARLLPPFAPKLVLGLPSLSACLIQMRNRFLALAADGTVWRWGEYDQERDGWGASRLNPSLNPWIPQSVPNLEHISMIAAGVWHAMALRSNGTVWTWGSDNMGVSGRGATSSIPRRVPGLDRVKYIASGDFFCLAVRTDGTVWGWGTNDSGQMGDDTKRDHGSPVQIPALKDAAAVAAGGQHALALLSDGTVWGWGKNIQGQLGDGTEITRFTAAPVVGLGNIVAIGAGLDHSVALDRSGAVWMWGYRAAFPKFREEGRPTSTVRPEKIHGLPPLREIATTGNHTIGLDDEGYVWIWGNPGDGDTGPRKIDGVNLGRR